MKFDKETIIVLALCLVMMLAWPSICESLGWSVPAETPVEESVQPAVPATPAAPSTPSTPATFDAGIIAAVVALTAGAGVIVSKKRR